MELESGSKPKVLVGQLRILLEAIEADSTLYNGQNEMLAILNVEKWLKLAEQLNAFPNGAQLSASSWKYVLRYWVVNTKKNVHRERHCARTRGRTNTTAEARELAFLEKKLYRFVKKEESREVLDVSYKTVLDPPATEGAAGGSSEGLKVVLEMFNLFGNDDNDENSCPDGSERRTIIMKEDDPADPTGKTKKFKIIFDKNLVKDRIPTFESENMEKMQKVSQELEEQIANIQSRIFQIKDMWKHRCGHN